MYFADFKTRRTSLRLARLMELYESNYMLMRVLAPAIRDLQGGTYVSEAEGCLALYLKSIEECKYTSTVNLSYRFSSESRQVLEPDLNIRIYHDARTAEAMSGLIHGRRHEQRRTRDLDQGWELNSFLCRWIKYCLHRGHKFDGQQRSEPITQHLPREGH